MKHILYTLFVSLLFCAGLQAQKTIFVKANATGSNNGTSWTDAFTALPAALTAAVAGDQIWVAAGTYKPDAATANNVFTLAPGVELYGGFAGTESNLSQRNAVANPTILSGDLSGNDTPGNFTTNRSDNARHVVYVTGANPSKRAIIDGFTIRAGNTLVATADPDLTKRGGGILAVAKTLVRNCYFTDNQGLSGASIAAIAPNGNGLVVDQCVFEANKSTAEGAGIYLRNLTAGEINNCIFRNNSTNRGTLNINGTNNILVDSCLFENNTNTEATGYCAGMFTWQSSYTLTNSTFTGNEAYNGAAMYTDGRDGGDFFTIDRCLFENNNSTNYGGSGMFNWQSSYALKNSTFRGNTSPRACGIYNDGREFDSYAKIDSCLFEDNIASVFSAGAHFFKSDYEMNDCIFRGNKAPDGASHHFNADSTTYTIRRCLYENGESDFGGAMSNYSKGNNGTIEDCVFRNNLANTSGGAIINAFQAHVKVVGTLFEANAADFGAGIFCQNDSTELTLEGCSFQGNGAQNSGGAVNVSSGISLTVKDCEFLFNSANRGAAIEISEDSLDLTKMYVSNTIFQENLANEQGGALNISATTTELVNCLFAKNENFGTGAGGAISNNAADGKSSPILATNCTFVNNVAVIGAGIAQWTDGTGTAPLTLVNCILQNPGGNNYAIEAGTPTVNSLGGNLSSDASLSTYLTLATDAHGLDAKFVDPDFNNFHLQAGSPCINKGVSDGAPAKDLDGNPRDAQPDKGCYEFASVGTFQPVDVQSLALAPNPAIEETVLSVDNDWNGAVRVDVFNQNGQRVLAHTTGKPAGIWNFRVAVQDLPAGLYQVRAVMGQQVYAGELVKM